jgi:hypothetical protein
MPRRLAWSHISHPSVATCLTKLTASSLRLVPLLSGFVSLQPEKAFLLASQDLTLPPSSPLSTVDNTTTHHHGRQLSHQLIACRITGAYLWHPARSVWLGRRGGHNARGKNSIVVVVNEFAIVVEEPTISQINPERRTVAHCS